MKLMTLNIWDGHVHEPLLDFTSQLQDVDIICLQEVYHQAAHKVSDDDRAVYLDIFSEMQAQLPGHQGLFKPIVGQYGIGLFVKSGVEILDEGEILIYENPEYRGMGPSHSRNLQWVKCRNEGGEFAIFNVHGLWNGKGKSDSPERISQSERIRDFMATINGPKILCGDFNLRPDTESVRLLEKGMRNLIAEHGVTSTRTSFYPKSEGFADYIFTSHEVDVHAFHVLPDEVSDHAPLLLDFRIP